jgi:hypothetical protein
MAATVLWTHDAPANSFLVTDIVGGHLRVQCIEGLADEVLNPAIPEPGIDPGTWRIRADIAQAADGQLTLVEGSQTLWKKTEA